MVTKIERVIVLAGGPSPEAEVSRSTAKGVHQACVELGYKADVWELAGDWMMRLAQRPRQGLFVFIALHGCPGEDGSVQGVLDLLGIPYQGSGVGACALAMDKIVSRIMFERAGLDVAAALWGAEAQDPEKVAEFIDEKRKVVVKPATGGSTIGVTILDKISGWPAAVDLCEKYGPVLAEEYIPGQEFTVTVLGDKAMGPVIEIVPQGYAFYDYDSKYKPGGSSHKVLHNPMNELENRMRVQAAVAAAALGCTGVSRVDFRYDIKYDRLVVLEVNTLPGMTPTSLVPDAAKAVDMSYAQVVQWMIEDGLKQRGLDASALLQA
jgi:D-alanine-D-alanine ligase